MNYLGQLGPVFLRPHLYFIDTFDEAVAFVVGFDLALGGVPLKGWSTWLADKLGYADTSVTWPAMIQRITGRTKIDGSQHAQIDGNHIQPFFDLLTAFLDENGTDSLNVN